MLKNILSLVFTLGFLGLTLPACAQKNPVWLRNAIFDGEKYLFFPAGLKSSVQKTIELETLSQRIFSATQPSIYIFPMQPIFLPTPQDASATVSFIPHQVDLISGATFRPHSATSQKRAHAKIVLRSDIFEDLLDTTYSGAIFKDADDIFGIIPTHTFRWQTDNPFSALSNLASLSKTIELEVYDAQGRGTSLRAEVVQLGALQDVSLIKFHPEDEEKLSPLLLRTQEISADTLLHVQGFNQEQQLVHLTGLSAFRTTSTFIQVRLPGTFDQRTGLCGSPARDESGRLAGVLIGHRRAKDGQPLDIGYIAPLSSIKTLLEAYRNGGRATFPLQLNNQTIMQLGVDEWIQRIYLFDKESDFIWGSGPISKFSYQQIERKINELSPAHMVLDIFQIHWSKDGELVRKPLKQVAYSFRAQKIEWEHYEK